MQGILLPEMTSKSIDIRCLEHGAVQKVGGNKVKQELKVRVGIEQTTSKKIVSMLKDSKMKVQASHSGRGGACDRRQTRHSAGSNCPRERGHQGRTVAVW